MIAHDLLIRMALKNLSFLIIYLAGTRDQDSLEFTTITVAPACTSWYSYTVGNFSYK